MEIIIIAAMAENRVIGRDNALPWSLKEDMARFRRLTDGWPCIMGRKTWESLPARPLPGRLNVVISQTMNSQDAPGALVLSSLHEALRQLAGHQKMFICGGESIYREALSFATGMELTIIHQSHAGDVFFPEIDPAQWLISGTEHGDGYSFISYRKNTANTVE